MLHRYRFMGAALTLVAAAGCVGSITTDESAALSQEQVPELGLPDDP